MTDDERLRKFALTFVLEREGNTSVFCSQFERLHSNVVPPKTCKCIGWGNMSTLSSILRDRSLERTTATTSEDEGRLDRVEDKI